MEPAYGFNLTFKNDTPHMHPNGYWVACTEDGNWDASGNTVENAMAELINVLHQAWAEERDMRIDVQNRARREAGV